VSTGVDDGKTPPSPFPTLRPRDAHAGGASRDAHAGGADAAGGRADPAPRPGQVPPPPPGRPSVPEPPFAPPRPPSPPGRTATPEPSSAPPRPSIPPPVPPPAAPPAAGPHSAAPLPPPAAPPTVPPQRDTGVVPAQAPPPAFGYVRLEPRPSRAGARIAAALSLVLGLGLIGGAVAGAVINHGPREAPPVVDGSPEAFAAARLVWRDAPVDTLFPPTMTEQGAGPGGADRSWTRIGVAPPAGCAGAFDSLLARVLAPAGCVRLLRATYVDSTSTTVTTVGILVTSGEAPAMRALNQRWAGEHLGERTDLLPKALAFPGTAAASFGDHQRGSWTVQVAADLPFVVYAVSGFADGRGIPAPQPADKAAADGVTTAVAQAGLGFDATGVASAVDDRLHSTVTTELHPPTHTKKPAA
jgi:hypothetical protein